MTKDSNSTVSSAYLESLHNLKANYGSAKQEFYRYRPLRDYYNKEITLDPTVEENGVVQIIISSYKGMEIRIITALYQKLTTNKHKNIYIKEKWES